MVASSGDERGDFGVLEGVLSVAAALLSLGILLAVTWRSSAYHYGSGQTAARIAADNLIVDLQAIGAYDRSPYAALFANGGTAASSLALPSITPFPGATSFPAAAALSGVQLSGKAYEDGSGRIEGAIDIPASSAQPALHVPVAIVQGSSGSKDCPAALAGIPGTGC